MQEITGQDIRAFIASRPPPGDEDHFDSKRSRYCNSISAAATKGPDWALRFLDELASSGTNEGDLWSAAVTGLRNAKLSSEEWAAFIAFGVSTTAPRSFFEAVADLLEHGSSRETSALSDELMPAAQRLAERLWLESLRYSPASDRQMGDWLTEAINRPGGKLAMFWLQRVSSAKRSSGEKWTAIPPEIAQSLRTIISDSSQAAAYARVVLASQLHYIFSIDAVFAQAELLPLFNWARDSTVAEQCWHGFLMWGRWLPGFTEQLLPSFDEMIRRAPSQSEDVKRGIIMHIVALALYRLSDPLSNDWLPSVIRNLDEQNLCSLAAEIDHALNDVKVSTAEEIWERWLKRYWEERLLGRPKPFSLEEVKHTGGWALSVGKHFPEAVKLVAALQPMPSFEHIGFLSRLDSKEVARTYPAATADLLLVYFSRPDLHPYVDETLQKIWRDLVQANLSPDRQRLLREAMFRFGIDPQNWT